MILSILLVSFFSTIVFFLFCFLVVSFMFYHVVYGSDQHVIGCGCTVICIVFLSCFNHHIICIMLKFIQKEVKFGSNCQLIFTVHVYAEIKKFLQI